MKRVLALIFLLSIALVGCSSQNKNSPTDSVPLFNTFGSSEYGFSFDYPLDWSEVTRDLPIQWAITKGTDTIIFTVNDGQSADLLTLGRAQALRDMNSNSSQEQINEALQIVGLAKFGERDWYTYAMDFSNKDVNTVISGTLCNDKEVTLVLVSSKNTFEDNKEMYVSLLESFEC